MRVDTPPLSVLQLNASDGAGGAAGIANALFSGYRAMGWPSRLIVPEGFKYSNDQDVCEIAPQRKNDGLYAGLWASIGKNIDLSRSNSIYTRRFKCWTGSWFAHPIHTALTKLGIDDFNWNSNEQLLKFSPFDILHGHNLFANWFDLNSLYQIGSKVPFVLTLHDEWLLTGHCACTFSCNRWKIGCGHCPDLKRCPEIPFDVSSWNWRKKRAIYKKSLVYIATPSKWLMNKVDQSILSLAAVEKRVINNGVDLSVFNSCGRENSAEELEIQPGTWVLMFSCNNLRLNIHKDYDTLCKAARLLSERLSVQKILLLIVGERSPSEYWQNLEVRFMGYHKDRAVLAKMYRAADVYVHAAHTDNYPTVIMEALACGTPVVATAIGGIPEQIKDGITGFLVPPKDAEAMAEAIFRVLQSSDLRREMGQNATEDAVARFDQRRMVAEYAEWYREILASRNNIGRG